MVMIPNSCEGMLNKGRIYSFVNLADCIVMKNTLPMSVPIVNPILLQIGDQGRFSLFYFY